MKTKYIIAMTLMVSTAHASNLVECDLIDYGSGGRGVATAKAYTDNEFHQVNRIVVGSVGDVQASVSFVQVLSNNAARVTLKLGDAVATSTIFLDDQMTIEKGLITLQCSVKSEQ